MRSIIVREFYTRNFSGGRWSDVRNTFTRETIMSGLMDHIHNGGWGMYPTMAFGLALLFVALKYAMGPHERWVPLLTGLSSLTLASGGLGFTSGLIVTCQAVGAERFRDHPPINIVIAGFGESLNNLAFALLFLVIAALAGSYGAFRLARMARLAPEGL